MRTLTVVGWTHDLPSEGSKFFMCAKSLDPTKKVRYIRTSIVKDIRKISLEKKPELLFYTENSAYLLEIINESKIQTTPS